MEEEKKVKLSQKERDVIYTRNSRNRKKEQKLRELLKDCKTVEDVIPILCKLRHGNPESVMP